MNIPAIFATRSSPGPAPIPTGNDVPRSVSVLVFLMIRLIPGDAVAIMLGANVGTTLIVQVLSFNIAEVAPILFIIGLVAFRSGPRSRIKDLGRVAIGLGLVRGCVVLVCHRVLLFLISGSAQRFHQGSSSSLAGLALSLRGFWRSAALRSSIARA